MSRATVEESYKYHRATAKRSMARRYYVVTKALRWMKRHQPKVLARIHAEAYRKMPNPSGDKRPMRISA